MVAGIFDLVRSRFGQKKRSEDPTVAAEKPILVFMSSRMGQELMPFRRRLDRALRPYADFLRIWRFETLPPSEPASDETYLRAVAESDLVIFLSGSDIKEGTEQEIARAVELGKDLLVFELANSVPDERVRHVRDLVRTHSSTATIPPGLREFESAVRVAVRDYLIRRLRDPAATPIRHEVLRRLRSDANQRLRTRLEAVVDSFAASRFVANERFGVLDGLNARSFAILSGPPGAGKSTALDRALISAVSAAEEDVFAPAPVFLRARDIQGTLRDRIADAMRGLGGLTFNGAVVTIDGLDELDPSLATEILSEASALVTTDKVSIFAATSREVPLALRQHVMPVPALDDQQLSTLLSTVLDRQVMATAILRVQPDFFRDAHRPLLGLLVGAAIARGRFNDAPSYASLVDIVVERALGDSLPRGERQGALASFAARLVDDDLFEIEPAAVGLRHDVKDLLETRLVERRGERLAFSLDVLRSWFAARFLLDRSLDDVIARTTNPELSDRWRSALILYAQMLDDKNAQALLGGIAGHDPVLAAAIAEQSTRAVAEPDPVVTGKRMRDAMASFGVSLPRLAPLDANGNLLPLYYALRPGFQAEWGWFRRYLDEIAPLPQLVHDLAALQLPYDRLRYITVIRGRAEPSSRSWPFVAAKIDLVGEIDHLLKSRGFHVDLPAYERERQWNEMVVITGRGSGSINDDPIPLQDVLTSIGARTGDLHFPDGEVVRADALRVDVSARITQGETVALPPFPVADLPRPGRTYLIGERFSDERLLARLSYAVEVGNKIYEAIIRTWFPALATRLERAMTSPYLLRGSVWRSERGSPAWHRYIVALPADMPPNHDIAFRTPPNDAAAFAEMATAIAAYRRQFEGRINSPIVDGVVEPFGSNPAREFAYRWLSEDLVAIGWASKAVGPYA